MNTPEFLKEAPLGRKMTMHGVRGNFTGTLVLDQDDTAFLLDEENRELHLIGREDIIGITYRDVTDNEIHMLMSNLEDGANQVE